MKTPKIFSFFIIALASIFLGTGAGAAPAAISDLSCVFSGNQGTVLLSWSAPAGAGSYDIRYSTSTITEYNFSSFAGFRQDNSGFTNNATVNSLQMNRSWFFAAKAIGESGELSEISNIAECFITTKPISSITDPLGGAVISAGGDYIIKGQSSDVGGSSVQKVEISFDGGDTWREVLPKNSAGSGFTWEYQWKSPSAGLYLIKTRATDWWGNMETDNVGISVQVVLGTSAATSSGSTAVVLTQEALKAQIIAIQQQIIQLIMQLISLLGVGV